MREQRAVWSPVTDKPAPGDKVTFDQYIGHRVEVTGVMIPGGDGKTETKTKIEWVPEGKHLLANDICLDAD